MTQQPTVNSLMGCVEVGGLAGILRELANRCRERRVALLQTAGVSDPGIGYLSSLEISLDAVLPMIIEAEEKYHELHDARL